MESGQDVCTLQDDWSQRWRGAVCRGLEGRAQEGLPGPFSSVVWVGSTQTWRMAARVIFSGSRGRGSLHVYVSHGPDTHPGLCSSVRTVRCLEQSQTCQIRTYHLSGLCCEVSRTVTDVPNTYLPFVRTVL